MGIYMSKGHGRSYIKAASLSGHLQTPPVDIDCKHDDTLGEGKKTEALPRWHRQHTPQARIPQRDGKTSCSLHRPSSDR